MWWNVFASKACQFLRALGSVMVLIVLSLIGLTYYTTVVLVYGPLASEAEPDSYEGRFAYGVLVVYHVLILMVLWSYFACVLTEPGRVPDGWTPPPEDEEDGGHKSNSEKLRRFCRKCTAWKPERCHHCSVCGRCVLKMDHHCVWVANCVGAYNYKFFMLFLVYTFTATVFDAVVLLSNFVDFFKDLQNGGDSGESSGTPGLNADGTERGPLDSISSTAWKPERCHHCSVCGRCVLKMDHHCVWVANCVGAYNYKFFMLFLVYTFTATVFDAVVLLSNFVDFFKDLQNGGDSGESSGTPGLNADGTERGPLDSISSTHDSGSSHNGGEVACVFVTFVLDVAFAASLLGFIIMHANLNLSNMTTIEMYEKKKTLPWRYNQGHRKNFTEVFGVHWFWWLLPVHSSDQLRRLLDSSRVSGGTYPDMELDGLDPLDAVTLAGDSPRGLDGRTCGPCI